ncbi:MAG: DEAD/DEAH box helicase [Chloroflexi bacterium]|nr:DEAD/DEAH box helicase [Chloroflexota bacterium]
MDLRGYLAGNSWETVYEQELPAGPGRYESAGDLDLAPGVRRLLRDYPQGIYSHQKAATRAALAGDNVCLTTSTASGKSLVMYMCAAEMLANQSKAKVLAIYPLRALASEQEERWRQALAAVAIGTSVGRIDGSIPTDRRLPLLKTCSVMVMTPDIIHAWLLSNVGKSEVTQFLRELCLVVIDEAHTYSGVFGSNTAFLLRRLNHLTARLGAHPRYLAASATMKNSAEHLHRLTGLPFHVIGQDADSSPRQAKRLLMVKPPVGDLLTSCSDLMNFVANHRDEQFIAFVDSRKQVEHFAAAADRQAEALVDGSESELDFSRLQGLRIYPYRSGYEEADREQIHLKLRTGELRGVVSTSALEMGIDIPHLTVGILVGVPGSGTSFFQRIGRVGRQRTGTIIVVNDGSVLSERIFQNPAALLDRPLSESTLYLDNQRIQYIHALCLARQGGEDDAISLSLHRNADEDTNSFTTSADVPAEFVALCTSERIGEVPAELQTMKAQAGDDPNHVFPLRDVDVQYKVYFRHGPEQRDLGSLSYGQLLREAYPGAIYYYQTQAFRVTKVDTVGHNINVRPDRRYSTKPAALPALIFPNFSAGNIHKDAKFGDLVVVECNLQIRESLVGFTEQRGPNRFSVNYPLDPKLGIFFDQQRFTRNYFTSGVLLNHPVLNEEHIDSVLLAEILFEAFLITIPFERQDVQFGTDRHRGDRLLFREGDRFLAIYDQTYGSLRLTSRLMNQNVILDVLRQAMDITSQDRYSMLSPATTNALRRMYNAALTKPETTTGWAPKAAPDEGGIVVIRPGSKGLNVRRNNEEFTVDGVFFHPTQGLSYRGRYDDQHGTRYDDNGLNGPIQIVVSVGNLVPIPGESHLATFDPETGEIKDIAMYQGIPEEQ